MATRIVRPRPKVVVATTSPTSANDITQGFQYFSQWYNSDTGELFTCVNPTAGNALWIEGSGGGGVHVDTRDPLPTDDAGEGYQTGSGWLNVANRTLWVSIADSPDDNAVWWNHNNLAHLGPYVVGPIGFAPYQTIQSAIDAASNGDIVHILDGTYAEVITLKSGVTLRAVTTSNPVSQAPMRVFVDGTMTWSPAAGVQSLFIEGIDVDGSTGSPAIDVVPATGSVAILQAERVNLTGADAPAVRLGTGGIIAASTINESVVARTYTSVAGAAIVANHVTHNMTFERCQIAGPSGVPGIKTAVDVSGGGDVKIRRCDYGNIIIHGQVAVSGGSSNKLQLERVGILPGTGDAHVDITGTLDLTDSHWFDVIDQTQPNQGGDITISGVNAATFVENPIGYDGDLRQYNGNRWVNRQIAANPVEYLVGAAGDARFQTIQAAIDQAVVDGYDNSNPVTVFIQPGTYNENLTLYGGISLQGLAQQVTPRAGDTPEDIIIDGTLTFHQDDAGMTVYSVTVTRLIVQYSGTGSSTLILSGTAGKSVRFNDARLLSRNETTLPLIDQSSQTGRVTFGFNGGAVGVLNSSYTLPAIELSVASSSLSVTNCLISAGPSAPVSIKVSAANCWVFLAGADEPAESNTGVRGAVEFTSGATNLYGSLSQIHFEPTTNTSEIIANGTFMIPLVFRQCSRTVGLTRFAQPIRVTGTARNDVVESPIADSGSVLQYQNDGVEAQQWTEVQFAAQGTDYLVGPAGQAKYTTIQSAIDQAVTDGMSPSNPMTVWVLDGTYNENITLHPGLRLAAVNYHPGSTEIVLDSPDVTINGTVSFTNTLAGPPEGSFVHLDGLNVVAPSGSPALSVNSSAAALVIVLPTGCGFTSTNSDVLSLTKGSASSLTVQAALCSFFGNNGRLARLTGGETITLRNCRPFVITATRSIVLAGGRFYVYNDNPTSGEGPYFNAPIEVEAASTGNVLQLFSVGFVQSIGSDVIADGAFGSTSYYRDCFSQFTQKSITVSGTNAAAFVEAPTANANDVSYYDGSRWQVGPLPAAALPAHAIGGAAHTADTPTNLNTKVTGDSFQFTSEKSIANGYASLDGSGKVPTAELPASVLGDVSYQGTWNASTNTPALASGVGTKGYYYVVSVAGSTNLDGITDWEISDWVIFNGTVWEKVDNTDSVTSVFTRTGAIVAQSGDYTHAQIGSVGIDDHHARDHKDTHKSAGADAFVAADILEATVKRLQTSTGPTTLVMGAVADGEVLTRSGSAIIGEVRGDVTAGANLTDKKALVGDGGVKGIKTADFYIVNPTDDLDALLNAVASGSTILLADGNHVIDAQADMTGKTGITILGRGKSSVITVTYGAGAAIKLSASHRFTMMNVAIEGTVDQPFIEDDSAAPSTQVVIDSLYDARIVATDTGTFLNFPAIDTARQDLTIMNCRCDRTFRGARFIDVLVTGTGTIDRVLLLNNQVMKAVTTGNEIVRISQATGVATNVNVTGNQLAGSDVCLELTNCQGVIVANNSLSGAATECLTLSSSEALVVGNHVYDSTGNAIEMVTGTTGCLVIGNLINTCVIGINFNGADNAIIGNWINGTTSHGIEGGDGGSTTNDHCLIAANVVYGPGSYGLNLIDVADSLCIGNIVESPAAHGIYVNISRQTAVIANHVNDPADTFSCIINAGAADRHLYVGNYCQGGEYGIFLDRGVDHLVVGNYTMVCVQNGIRVDGAQCAVIGNRVSGTTTAANIRIAGAQNSAVGNLLDGGFDGGIDSDGADALIVGNFVYNAGSQGINPSAARSTVVGNHVATTAGIGINFGAGADYSLCVANTVYAAGNSGINMSGTDTLTVGNFVHDPGTIAIDSNAARQSIIGNYCELVASGTVGVQHGDEQGVIVGNKIIGGSSYGIECSGGLSIICGNEIADSGNDAIYCSGGGGAGGDDIAIVGNLIYNSDDNGIDYALAQRVVVVGNVIKNVGLSTSGYGIYGSGQHAVIVGNSVDGTQGVSGIQFTGSYTICVGNSLLNVATDGIVNDSGDYVVILGNMIEDPGDDGIYVPNAQYNVIASNVITLSNRGILVANSGDHLILGNVVRSTLSTGILVFTSSPNCSVIGNYLNSIGGSGIEVSASYTVVAANYVNASVGDGVEISGLDVLVVGNYVNDPTARGINTTGTATRPVIIGNFVYESGTEGIFCVATRAQLVGNLIYLAGGDAIEVQNTNAVIVGNWTQGGTKGIDLAGGGSVVASNHIQTPGATGIETSGPDTVVCGNIVDVSNNGDSFDTSGTRCAIVGNIARIPGSGYRCFEISNTYSVVAGNIADSPVDDAAFFVDGVSNAIVGNLAYDCSSNAFDITANLNSLIGNIAYNVVGIAIDLNTANGCIVVGNGLESVVDGVRSDGGGECVVVGNRIQTASNYGVYIAGASRSVVIGNMIDGSESGIYFSSAPFSTAVGNVVYNSTDYGLRVVSSSRCVFVGNLVYTTVQYHGIQISNSIECTVTANVLENIDDDGIWSNSSSTVICGNNINDCGGSGIYTSGIRAAISGNYITGTVSSCINPDGDYSAVTGNVCSGGSDGIDIDGDDCNVVGNMIYDTSGDGIRAVSARGNVVGNYIYSTSNHGIVANGDDSSIKSNYLHSIGTLGDYGILLLTGSYMTCNDNKIVTVQGVGIFASGVDYSQINDNHIRGCTVYGIHLDETDESMVNDNRLYANNVGIREDSDCDYNAISDNHARGNTTTNLDLNGTNRTAVGNKS